MELFEDLRKRLSLNGIKDNVFEDNPKMAKKRNEIAVSQIMSEEAQTYVIYNLQVNSKVVDTVVPFEKELARLLTEWTKTNVAHRPCAQRSRFGTSQTSRS